ncbi:MAG: hypothetical protein AB8B88_11460 [Devosiaceae bacterium]
MAHLPAFWGTNEQESPAADTSLSSTMMGGQSKLMGAVSTLLALTPRGRPDELARLCALAHGYIGVASEDELVTLAKAVAGRDDVSSGLPDRLARTNARAAQTLIRANRLGDETIAYLLESGDEALRALIARHHTLAGKHVTMLVADGNPKVLQALLENRRSNFSHDTQKIVERGISSVAPPAQASAASGGLGDLVQDRKPGADPKRSAQEFASMDAAARRAVMHRLADDTPAQISFSGARKALDPTRNDADLAFLTVIEQRDPTALRDAFAKTLGLDPVLVGKLLDEADGDALIVLAKGAGISSTAFARMLILGKIGLTGSPRDTFALVDRFNDLPQASADLIVQAMRGENKKSAAQGNERKPLPTPASAAAASTSVASKPAQTKPRSIMSLAQERKPTPHSLRRAV